MTEKEAARKAEMHYPSIHAHSISNVLAKERRKAYMQAWRDLHPVSTNPCCAYEQREDNGRCGNCGDPAKKVSSQDEGKDSTD